MKKFFEKVVLFLTVLAMCLSFTSCSGSKNADVSTPEGTVEAMLTAFAEVDYEEIEKYVDLDKILSRESNEDFLADPDVMMNEVFSQIKFNVIESVKQDDDTYLVKTQIVTTDMGSAVSEYIIEVMSYIYGEEATTQEDAEKYQEELFLKKIKDKDRNITYNEVDIKVVKDGESWKVEADDAFANAVLGGFYDAVDDLMTQIEATEENNAEATESAKEEVPAE